MRDEREEPTNRSVNRRIYCGRWRREENKTRGRQLVKPLSSWRRLVRVQVFKTTLHYLCVVYTSYTGTTYDEISLRGSRVCTDMPCKFGVSHGAPIRDPAVRQALIARSIRFDREREKGRRKGELTRRITPNGLLFRADRSAQLYIQSENHHSRTYISTPITGNHSVVSSAKIIAPNAAVCNPLRMPRVGLDIWRSH